MGVDDNGNAFELSPDPLLDTVRPYVADVKLGEAVDAEKLLKPVLENEKIFGVNLYDLGTAGCLTALQIMLSQRHNDKICLFCRLHSLFSHLFLFLTRHDPAFIPRKSGQPGFTLFTVRPKYRSAF